MKKTIILAAAVLGMAMAPTPPKGSSLTLKERIDMTKVVKVYFSNSDIVNVQAPAGNNNRGTGCKPFSESTPMPTEYIDAAKLTVDLLNKGFNTTAFVEGDLSTVPVFASGMQKNTQDWLTQGEPLVFVVWTSGAYFVRNMGLMNSVDLENSMYVESNLSVYGLDEGKIKTLETKNLVWKSTPAVKTKACDDFAYFTQNFQANSLAEPFKTALTESTREFAEKQMKKYEKKKM